MLGLNCLLPKRKKNIYIYIGGEDAEFYLFLYSFSDIVCVFA
jgi:hypothetical protein